MYVVEEQKKNFYQAYQSGRDTLRSKALKAIGRPHLFITQKYKVNLLFAIWKQHPDKPDSCEDSTTVVHEL